MAYQLRECERPRTLTRTHMRRGNGTRTRRRRPWLRLVVPMVVATVIITGLSAPTLGLNAAAATGSEAAGDPEVSHPGSPPLPGSALKSAAVPNLTWVRTGGPLGGLGYDVRMRPDDPDTLLVTDAYAGVFRSSDGGANWQPSNSGITVRTGTSGDAIPVFCLTIDPHDNDIVWAGTQYLRGIFRSADGGKTWTQMNNGVLESEGITFRGFTVDPRSSDIVYAAAELSSWQWNSGVPLMGREFDLTKGVVYKTTDGGAHWTAVWRGDNLARYIWIDPDHPDTVYVSTGIFDREAANSVPSSATPGGEGVVKSTNGGSTWTPVNAGLDNLYVGSLFMHPENPQVLLAGTGHNQYFQNGGVYLSTDGGASWNRTLTGEVITSVEFAEADPKVAYAGSLAHVFRSEDGGVTWRNVTGSENFWGPPGVCAGFPIDFQVDPRNSFRVFANNYGGGNFVSEDGGATWSIASKGYTGAQSRDIAVDPIEPGRVITACRSGIFESSNGGSDWTGIGFPPVTFIEWNAVAVDPEDAQHLLAATNLDGQVAESSDGGLSWTLRDSNLPPGMFAYRDLVFAPSDSRTVYAGTGAFSSAGQYDDSLPGRGVYVSRDGGANWQAANDQNSASVQAADIAVHPANPQIAFVAALKSGLLKTINGGIGWSKLAGSWPSTASVKAVALSPADPQIVFVGTDSGLFRTSNGGATWQQLTSGFAPESVITSIVGDPTDPQVLYLSDITGGVYRTENGGGLWAPVNQGLRTKAVNRLAISSDGVHLYAATEGEGVFRLDLNGSPPPAAKGQQFSDVPSTHPYSAAISDLAGRTIINGYPDGTFKPDNPVIRQQFAKMIVKTRGYPVSFDDVCPFTDVPSNLSASDPLYPDHYVAVCAARGITVGYPGNVFKPTISISRQQLITMVARTAGLAEPPPGYDPGFSPGQFSADHYQNARNAAYAGLLDGLQGVGETYNFFASASRGECAQLLHNLLGNSNAVSAGQITNPWWAETGTDPPAWRYDSRTGQPTVQLGVGTTLIYRALVRDESGEVLAGADVFTSRPKMVALLWRPGVMTPVQSVWDPAAYITDASGFLYWVNGGAGYWGTVDPGDVIGVSFWLDFDDDDMIDDGAEADSNIPGWGTPWAQWEFVVP